MKATTTISLVLTGLGATIIATSAPASAVTFSFQNISGGDTVGDAYAKDFTFDVTNNGDGTVLFKFFNNASVNPALKQVAFSVDQSVSSLLDDMNLNVGNIGGVLFESKTQNLSQSNKISGWDGTTFGAETKGGNANAVQLGESLGIKFDANFNAVIAAINAGTLKVGIHVGSLPRGASDSYVNVPNTSTSVPEPSTMLGAGIVFGVTTLFKGNKAKKQKLGKLKA